MKDNKPHPIVYFDPIFQKMRDRMKVEKKKRTERHVALENSVLRGMCQKKGDR